MTQQATSVNGVETQRLFETIDAVRQMPGLGKCHFRVHNRWIDGGHNRSIISNFYGAGRENSRPEPFVYDNDEPAVLLGHDLAANPVEFVLHALAGCLTSSMVYHAAAKGIAIEEIESHLEGDIDLRGFLGLSDQVPRGFQAIRVTFRIKAPNAAPEVLDELCQMAQKHSPVFDTLTRPVAIEVKCGQ